MSEHLGEALSGFDDALLRLREALAGDSQLCDRVFTGTEHWVDLLTYKLVPHMAGEGCLIAAVTGGTNCGKSTVFNLLLGEAVSPAVDTAAATRRPLLAANASRAAQCLESRLVPEFSPLPFAEAEAVLDREGPESALYVAQSDALPDRLVLLDTPDVDSIETEHWEAAEHIRASGDVLIAVVTAEKYKDERVVSFFKRARESGRVVIPVMNKANPENDYAVARQQLDEFRADVGTQAPRFVVPHDFHVAQRYDQPIACLDDAPGLRLYLESLDVPSIKERVFRATIEHFAKETGAFLTHVDEVAAQLRSVAEEFHTRARHASELYDPAPGEAVGGLFHAYVQSKRGPVRRVIGNASMKVARGAASMAKGLRDAFRVRAQLENEATAQSDEEIHALHAAAIERIVRDLATGYIESGQNLREPTAHLLKNGIDIVDLDPARRAVTRQVLRTESVSDAFRAHAEAMLDSWWNDNTGKRRVLEGLDALLAVAPAAIAAPISLYTGGVGVSEAVVIAGPMVEQFMARVIEYQFGDAMFDFLSPWRTEQQEALELALRQHLCDPYLIEVLAYCEVLEGVIVTDMRRFHEQCRTA
jgi:hypothetical protein